MDIEKYPKTDMLVRMDIFDKVIELLAHPDFTQVKLGRMLGVSQSTVARWAKREVEPEGANRDAIHALHQSIFGDAPRQVRLVGYIGAGAAIYPIDDGGDEWVEAPPAVSRSTVAGKVKGTSQLPMYEDGWIIYWSRHLPPEEMVNRRCVVQLADGRVLVKTLKRGSIKGHWTLASSNDEDIENVVVEWAAPIDWIKPRP